MSKTSFHSVVLSSAAKTPQPVNRRSLIPQSKDRNVSRSDHKQDEWCQITREDVLIQIKAFLRQLRLKLTLRAVCGRNAEVELN